MDIHLYIDYLIYYIFIPKGEFSEVKGILVPIDVKILIF